MTIKSYLPLNTAPVEYEEVNEMVTRRTIEQNFQDVASDLHNVKTQNDRDIQNSNSTERCQHK